MCNNFGTAGLFLLSLFVSYLLIVLLSGLVCGMTPLSQSRKHTVVSLIEGLRQQQLGKLAVNIVRKVFS